MAVPTMGLLPPPEKMPDTADPQFGQNLVSAATELLHLGQVRVVVVIDFSLFQNRCCELRIDGEREAAAQARAGAAVPRDDRDESSGARRWRGQIENRVGSAAAVVVEPEERSAVQVVRFEIRVERGGAHSNRQ